jgi:D-alanyl-D-alanine carboxypeptidase (penicillin-binding protein 5/6)
MRKFNIFTVFLISALIILSFGIPPASALSEPDIDAAAALLVETSSEKILYEHNKEGRVAPGSIAKVMTLLLAVSEVENGQAALTDNITVSETFLNGLPEDAPGQDIKPGEIMSYQDLMYCAFIASADDACSILAETIGGSVAGFVRKMNEKAKELGCNNTRFRNPGGLPDPNQYTTAWDQFLILKEAIGHPLFLQIAGTVSYTAKADEDSPERSLTNSNHMLRSGNPYYYSACIAGKTASSIEYGSSLVTFAVSGDLSMISVVFGVKAGGADSGTDDDACFSETIRLLEWGTSSFKWHDIVKQNEVVASEEINLAKGIGRIDLTPSKTITVLARSDLAADDIAREIVVYAEAEEKVLTAPIRKGDILGEMTVSINGAFADKVKLVAAQDAELDRGEFIKNEIRETLSIFWVQLVIVLVVLFIGFYIWLVIRDWRRRRARKRQMEEAKRRIIDERQRRMIRK